MKAKNPNLFNAQATNGRSAVMDVSDCATRGLFISTSGFTGNLAIQSHWGDPAVTWLNAPYRDAVTGQDYSNAGLVYSNDTNNYTYILPHNFGVAISVNLTSYSAGSVTVQGFAAENAASEPIPAVQRGTAGAAAPGQTLKQFTSPSGGVALANPLTVKLTANSSDYTVTNGKTFYCTDLHITGSFTAALEYQLLAAGSIIMQGFCKGDTGPVSAFGIETQAQAASGQLVQLKFIGLAVNNVGWFLSGYEQ